MKNKATDPFVVIRTTGNVEPVNRGGNIMFATPVITVNDRVSPFVQEFTDEQDAIKCTQEMIRELRKVVYDNTETLEVYDAPASTESPKYFPTAWSNSAEAKAQLALSTSSTEESPFNTTTVSTSPNAEQNTALISQAIDSPANDQESDTSEELMKKLAQFISGTRSTDNGISLAKKSVNDKLSSYNLMEKVIQLIPMKIVGEVLYYYNRTQCHYMQLTDVEARRLIMSLCREDVKQCGTPFIVKYVHEFITMNPDIVGDIHDTIHPDYLGFKNGILDLRSFKFMAPTPDIFITNIVDDYYDPSTPANCPNFDNFLFNCYDGNQALINRVWEAIGYILTDDINAKCFFLLLGPGDSGKSLLIKLICSFFREDAVCPLMINQFGERFGLSLANGKKLITCADLPKTPLTDSAVAMIKCLTGGDSISYEQKYKDMARFINTAKLIFASNFPITLVSQDQAFINRIVEIPFLHSVPKDKQVKGLYEILSKEKHAIIHRALNAYRHLRSRNYVFSGDEYLNPIKEQSVVPTVTAESVIQQFFEDCCSYDDSSFVTTEALHTAYTNFCAKTATQYLPRRNSPKCSNSFSANGFHLLNDKQQTAPDPEDTLDYLSGNKVISCTSTHDPVLFISVF